MEPYSPVTTKKQWNFLRVAFFMMRKGLISKRNLVMQRGKLMGMALDNLMFHHHSTPSPPLGPDFGLREYEFSCSNSPNPNFFHVKAKRRHGYFPCIHATPTVDELEEAQEPVIMLPRIQGSPHCDLAPVVDADAEEFIKRFYEKLRVQSPVPLLLQYPGTE